jgi:hypothetical protein
MNQNVLKASNKLRIVGCFDDLKNEIDLLVEIYISENPHDQACVDEINNARDEWIKEADECQAYNLAELENNENNDELVPDELLFKRHCFLIHSNADLQTTGCFTGRFISTDVYLRPGQIECFQELLKFTSSENKYLDEQAMDKEQLARSLKKIFVGVKLYEDVSEFFFEKCCVS